MIYLILRKNGLGNQMFAYAFAKALQTRYASEGYSEQIAINPARFYDGVSLDQTDDRQLSLRHLKLSPQAFYLDRAAQQKCDKAFQTRWRLVKTPLEHLQQILFKKSPTGETAFLRRSKKGLYQSMELRAAYPICLSSYKDKFVFGNYICKTYAEQIRPILCEEFTITTPPSPQSLAMAKTIRDCNSVCLHIRRGDYTNPKWKKLNICDFSYYQRAIDWVCSHTQNPHFFVFSDTHKDLLWIRENYHFINKQTENEPNITYVDLNNPDYEDLRLMTYCRHRILSNSTFSWWAAFLAQQEDSIICTPSRWDLTIPDDANMNCLSWTVISTENDETIVSTNS